MIETAETFDAWPTTYVAIVTRITAGMSIVSSSIILYVILMSASRLSPVYHRIMFCMSVFDIIGSFGMSLTSLPMPRQMPQEEELGFSWPGVRYGNTFTCNLQGFCIFFCTTCMLGYNVSLCVYYACAIALRFSEKNIRKYVQPFLLTLPIATGLWIAAPPLFHELYNPPTTTMSCAWCNPTTYPDRNFCADNSECILRGKEAFDDNKTLFLAWLLGFIIIAISIGLVVLSLCFRSNPKLSYTEEDRWNDDFDTDGNRATPSLSMLSNFKSISTPSVDMSRVLSATDDICTDAPSPKRGQFYSFKLEKVSSLPRRDGPRGKHKHDDLFDDIGGVSALQSDKSKNLSAAVEEQVDSDDAENESTKGVVDDDDDEKPNLDPHPAIVVLQALTYISIYAVSFVLYIYRFFKMAKQSTVLKLWLAFFPLHGFFNMIIFLSHKVYNYRRVHTETTVGKVISLLFTTNVQEPCFVERISIVNDYHLALSRGHNEAIQVSNEMGDRVFVRRSQLVQLAEGQPDRSETDENENYGGNIELPPVTTSQNSNSERYFVGSGSNLDISNAGISAGRSSALSGFSSFAGFLSFGSSKSAHTKSRDNDVAKKERNEVQCD